MACVFILENIREFEQRHKGDTIEDRFHSTVDGDWSDAATS